MTDLIDMTRITKLIEITGMKIIIKSNRQDENDDVNREDKFDKKKTKMTKLKDIKRKQRR